MFAVDMRLRPSGNKGPVAVSLAGVRALPRATRRLDLGAHGADPRARGGRARRRCARRVEAAIRGAIAQAGRPARIRADAAAMRARLLRDLPPGGPWDVKLRPGGQIEVEFIAQTLQLVHAAGHPGLLHPATRHALAALRDGGLLAADEAALLIRADRVWRSVQGLLRITYGRAPAEKLAEPAVAALLRAVAASGIDPPPVDVAALRATLETLAREVRAAFVRQVGEIGS